MKKLTHDDFIQRSKAVWNDRWDYERTTYERMATPVTLTCRLHGDFTHGPQAHLKGLIGCQECNGRKPIDLETLLERTKAKGYHELYDFSCVTIQKGGVQQLIVVRCLNHNRTFEDSVWAFLRGRSATGCELCGKSKRMTQEIFQHRASLVYPQDKYDYSLVDYSNGVKSKVRIICNTYNHGAFTQTIDNHLSGREGCHTCAYSTRLLSLQEFIKRGSALWGKTVDYSKLQCLCRASLQNAAHNWVNNLFHCW